LIRRLAAPLICHMLELFRTRQRCAEQAAHAWGVSRRQLYRLQHQYLKAFGRREHATWSPTPSGGNHAAP